MSPDKKPTKRAPQSLKRERTSFERALLLVSVASIAAVLVGLFLYAGDTAGEQASLETTVQRTGRLVDGGPEVLVSLTNQGGSGAEDVVVEVKIGEETREVSFVRIAKHEERTAAVVFPPEARGTAEASILSYNHP